MSQEPVNQNVPRFDDEDFVSLITASQRKLRAFILGLVSSQTDTDDVLQEVNLALWRKRHLYDPEKQFLRWACGFAALEARSFRSKSAKGRLLLDNSAIESLAAEWPECESFIDDCQSALASCLRKLDPQDQQVVESRYRSRLTVKQIAECIDRPPSSVYKILQRSFESLRSCIKRSQWQSGR